jgi:hypothetical protein
VIFEFLELTRAFAVTHVCDCGVIWRLKVLGVEWPRAGARAFRGGGGRGVAMLGGRVCDVVVTPCDLHRLENTQNRTHKRIDALLLLCPG